jgi:hypothetical protein
VGERDERKRRPSIPQTTRELDVDTVLQQTAGQVVELVGRDVAHRDDHAVRTGGMDGQVRVGDLAEPLDLPVPPRERVARTYDPADSDAELGVLLDQLEELVPLVSRPHHHDLAAEPALHAQLPQPGAVQAAVALSRNQVPATAATA